MNKRKKQYIFFQHPMISFIEFINFQGKYPGSVQILYWFSFVGFKLAEYPSTHVTSLIVVSERFFFHFSEVFKKCEMKILASFQGDF